VGLAALANAALPALVACAAMVVIIGLTRLALPPDLHPGLALALLVPLGALTYLGTILLFWRDVARESIAMLRK
jgi:hypothetical protein